MPLAGFLSFPFSCLIFLQQVFKHVLKRLFRLATQTKPVSSERKSHLSRLLYPGGAFTPSWELDEAMALPSPQQPSKPKKKRLTKG